MKYNCIRDELFYHINAVLNDGVRFSCSCTKEQMIDFVKKHRKGAKSQYKSDEELIKAYLAVQDKVFERPKPETLGRKKLPLDGQFVFLYLNKDLWKAIEKNVPKDKYETFISDAIEKILRQEGYYVKRKKEGK